MNSMLQRASVLVLLAFSAALPAAAQGLDLAREDVRAFVTQMQAQHGFDPTSLGQVLAAAKPQPRIIEIMQRPAEKSLSWWEYRARFLTEDRIAAGVRTWRAHGAVIARVAAETGVAPEFLVAITGIETSYGRILGGYRVLDALVTLAFDYPPRADFFRKELGEFLLMAREEQLDPAEPKGSYAGAMGIGQFMPSSFRAYAVDGDGDGHRDLWRYGPDVFASIANYFLAHGWVAGEPVLSEASHAAAPDDPAEAKAALNETIALLRGRGYQFDTTLPEAAPAMLVPAALQQGLAWRVGFQNFYVITRYNRSLLYAMAVNDLAEAIAARYRAAPVMARDH